MYSTLRLVAPIVALTLLASPSFAEDAKPAEKAAPAAAATAAKPQVAVLNVELLMRESSAAKSMREQYKKKRDALTAEFSPKEAALQKEDQELAKQRSVLTPEAFEKKLKEFREKATSTQRDARTKAEQIEKGMVRAGSEIQKATTAIIGQMAKDKGYVLVIPTQQTVYSDDSLDITDEVMKKLNAKLPKVTVNFSGK